jgi:exosortase H (IPTLxxWG-CTERM-specific)
MSNRRAAKNSAMPAGEPPSAAQAVRPGMVRFLWVFPVCVVAGFALLEAPFTRSAVNGFTALLVRVSALLVRMFGGAAAAEFKVLRNPATGFAITVEDTCNASNVVILLWAAVLAFPATWRQRAKGIVVGTLVLHAVNLLRIVSLFYLGQYKMEWFEFAHIYVWEGLMMLVTLVVFWNWVRENRETTTGQPAPESAATAPKKS